MLRRFMFRRSAARAFAGVALMAAAAMVCQTAFADDTTVSYDNFRTGWDPNEAALSPASVPGTGFGQIFSTIVTGQVYRQPLVVGGTLVAATEANNVYGINAATGAVLWSRNVGAPLAPWATCGDLTPQIGITSTPVYDPATKSVFFLSKVNDGPHYRGPGSSPPRGLGDSVMRLQVNGDGSLTAKDFFSPTNNAQLSASDSDFRIGGPSGAAG